MKKLKLILTAFTLLLGWSNALAQSWTGGASTEVYLKNVGSNLFWGAANSWGTQASLITEQQYVKLIANGDGTYKMETLVSNGGTNYYFNGSYMDGDAVSLTIASLGSGKYSIANGSTYYGWDGSSTVLATAADASSENFQWVGYTGDEIDKLNATALSAATAASPVDATNLILDAKFGRNRRNTDVWTITAANKTLNGGGADGGCAESYKSTFDLSQSLSKAPNGKYKLTAQAFYRVDGGTADKLPYIFISNGTDTSTRSFKERTGTENSMGDAATSFKNGLYQLDDINIVKAEGQSLSVGAKLEEKTNLWSVWANFQLTYYGNAVEVYSPTAFTSGSSATADTWYEFSVASAGGYKIKSSAVATLYYTQNGSDDADDIENNKTFTAGGYTFMNLEAGSFYFKSNANSTIEIEEMQNGEIVTDVYITNPSFESATAKNQTSMTGWANDGMQTQNNTSFAKTGTYYVEAWQPNGTKSISQTISGLPVGQYCLSAHCKARGVTSAKIYAGSNETPITIADSDADYFVYFTNDGNSNVSIGFQGVGTGANASWLAVDNFQLKYCGKKVEEAAIDMPSSGNMDAYNWYILIIPTAGNYNVTSTNAATIYYTQNGATSVNAGTSLTFTAGEQKSISLSAGTLFIKSSVSQVVDVDTRFYLMTTVNDHRKWLNKNNEGYTYAYDKGLPFKLESRNGYVVLNFGDGNYLNDVGSNWQTKLEGSKNDEWKLQSEGGGYKIMLSINNTCQLFIKDTSTGLIEMTRTSDTSNIWEFIQPETALSYAITDAEGHTLGFDNGEYAPYSNVTALTALATAKAATTNDARISAYTALTGATWTANVGEVNAFAYGDFSTYQTISGKDYPYGWQLNNGTDGNYSRIMGGTEGSGNAGLAASSTGKALLLKWNASYGETQGYTMPLNASTLYKITFKYCGWGGNSPHTNIVMTDPNSYNITLNPAFEPIGSHGESDTSNWTTFTGYFVSTTAGNYTFNLNKQEGGQQQIAIADIELKSSNDALDFADGSVRPTYAPGTYPTVKVTRSLAKDRWATAIYPFAVTAAGAGVEVATLDGFSEGALSFSTEDGTSVANKPFLMRASSAKDDFTLSSVAVAAASATAATSGKAEFRGVYSETTVSEEDDFAKYVLSQNTIYKIESTSAKVAPYRGYFAIDTKSGAKALRFVVDGQATNIDAPEVAETEEEEVLYNMAGVRVDKNFKGFVINQKGEKRFNK